MTPAQLRDLRNLYNWSLAKDDKDYYSSMAIANAGLGTEFASRKFKGVFEKDEILSMTYHALCKAAVTWNPSKSSFSTYANFYLRNEFNRAPSQIDAFRSRPDRSTIDHVKPRLDDMPSEVLDNYSEIPSTTGMDVTMMRDLLLDRGITVEEWSLYRDVHTGERHVGKETLKKVEGKVRAIMDDIGHGLYD